MKHILLGSVAIAAILLTGPMANAQGTSTSDTPPQKNSVAPKTPSETPKVQNEPREQRAPEKTPAASDRKSSSSENKERESQSKSAQEDKTPRAGTSSKDDVTKSKTSTSREKGAPAKSSEESRTSPSKSGAAKSSAPANDNVENKATTPANRDSSQTQKKSTTSVSGSPTISSDKAAKITAAISQEKAKPIEKVKFSLSVGVSVPSAVHVHALPAPIVAIVPEYRGYDYVVVREEIVIIEPRTRKIVTVIHSGDKSAKYRTSTRISLSPESRRTIKQSALKTSQPTKPKGVRLVVGAEVPPTYVIRDFPAEVLELNPELREYKYVVDEDNVVVVDMHDRHAIEIIN